MPASAATFLRLCLPVLLLFAAPLPAVAQSDMVDRLNRLENDLRSLQRQVYRGSPPPAGGSLPSSAPLVGGGEETSIANRLNARIDELENQIRTLTGRFEEVEFGSVQANRRLDKLVEDVDFRLTQLERAGQPGNTQQTGSVEQVRPPTASGPAAGAATASPAQPPAIASVGSTSATPGQAPSREGVLGTLPVDAQGRPLPPGQGSGGGAVAPAQAAPAQTAPAQTAAAPASQAAAQAARGRLPAGSTQERYNYAYRLLVQSDYAAAENAFREFLTAHAQDPLAGNAQYWLGETYYVRGQFEPAAQAFLKGYQGYAKSAKAPDSLLKLGMSLAALKKTPEACAALGQLTKEFPAALQHVKDAAARERTKLACK